ncbi:MAG: hypothetical protein JWL82_162 [Parcubacteria group bacterium]|nr:hypothetical protein [Parcubacteria group bacterium]
MLVLEHGIGPAQAEEEHDQFPYLIPRFESAVPALSRHRPRPQARQGHPWQPSPAAARARLNLRFTIDFERRPQAPLIPFCAITASTEASHSGLVLSIPKWILAKRSYRKACARGLVDTDGCLFVHKHRVAKKEYNNIGLCFSNYSLPVIIEMAEIFEEFGIMPHIAKQGRAIYLYQADAVAKYLNTFGTSNERILRVFEKWKRG